MSGASDRTGSPVATAPTRLVKALFGTLQPHLMVTDPPYRVDYDPTWRHRAGVNRSGRLGKVRNDERADWQAAWALFPGTSMSRSAAGRRSQLPRRPSSPMAGRSTRL